MIRRVRVNTGYAKGKMGYANVSEDELLNEPYRSSRKRHSGLWVTLDPEPSVAFGGKVAARPVTVWLSRYMVDVLTPSEEMGDVLSLIEQEEICVCGHPRNVHFAQRCFTPACTCSCTTFVPKEAM